MHILVENEHNFCLISYALSTLLLRLDIAMNIQIHNYMQIYGYSRKESNSFDQRSHRLFVAFEINLNIETISAYLTAEVEKCQVLTKKRTNR